MSPIQAVEKMLADAGRMTTSWASWWIPKGGGITKKKGITKEKGVTEKRITKKKGIAKKKGITGHIMHAGWWIPKGEGLPDHTKQVHGS